MRLPGEKEHAIYRGATQGMARDEENKREVEGRRKAR